MTFDFVAASPSAEELWQRLRLPSAVQVSDSAKRTITECFLDARGPMPIDSAILSELLEGTSSLDCETLANQHVCLKKNGVPVAVMFRVAPGTPLQEIQALLDALPANFQDVVWGVTTR